MNWPPEYIVRKSPKAKYVQLKITPEKGLEVVLPYRVGPVNIDDLLLKNQKWIEKKLSQVVVPFQKSTIPHVIQMPAIEENWSIHQLASSGKLQLLARPDYSLMLFGDISNIQECLQKLKNWLQKRAKQRLFPWVNSLSEQTGLMVNKLSIRSQKTRWGSCSPEGNISLNHKLLFLPTHITRYVIIHELCHLRHLNHSKRFWALVERFDPNYQEHRRLLSRLSQQIGDYGNPNSPLIL